MIKDMKKEVKQSLEIVGVSIISAVATIYVDKTLSLPTPMDFIGLTISIVFLLLAAYVWYTLIVNRK